ncbi:MAG: DUF2339 domain-containing protein [Bacteroidota bacterium]
MNGKSDKIDRLLEKLQELQARQDNFSKEIGELRDEIVRLENIQVRDSAYGIDEITGEPPAPVFDPERFVSAVSDPPVVPVQNEVRETQISDYKASEPVEPAKIKSGLEKFIGENLINKIGIAITVLGVSIGAKYSIDHDLISPLARIILGYLVGIGLFGIALKLRKDYENYSAVLVSGAMAIMFFLTYAAYSFYALLPQVPAFILLVIFTSSAVYVAIDYNKQVIAHIGLVGAYAVPFLLDEGSGKVIILFTYIAIINLGILLIAFRKYWKPLYISSFILTWVIFLFWYDSAYQDRLHYTLALTFISIFFVIFQLIFLGYKLIQKEKFTLTDIILFLTNSFVFFGLGYSMLSVNSNGKSFLGLYTLINAAAHFSVGTLIYTYKSSDRNLYYFVIGLALVFITMAVPVQLNGNWVTLLWAGESALLFWIGRTKVVAFYEKLSYILMILAFASIIHDWTSIYENRHIINPGHRITSIWNTDFLSAILFVATFSYINFLNNSKLYMPARFQQEALNSIIKFTVPAILLIVLYNTFRIEIATYWDQLYSDSIIRVDLGGKRTVGTYWDSDLKSFKSLWVLNYSLLFFSVLTFVNIRKIRNSDLGWVNLFINALLLIIFLLQGLYIIGCLRDSLINQELSQYYQRSLFNIMFRYIVFTFAGLTMASIYFTIKQDFLKPVSDDLHIAFDCLLFISVIWVASNELITWMDVLNSSQSNKLGLSILWGVYALILIVLGIWKKKKHLRVGAIVLFAITLAKLFFYDIAYLDTIAKTIVFVALGVLLLIISFLYNKYKHVISEE